MNRIITPVISQIKENVILLWPSYCGPGGPLWKSDTDCLLSDFQFYLAFPTIFVEKHQLFLIIDDRSPTDSNSNAKRPLSEPPRICGKRDLNPHSFE